MVEETRLVDKADCSHEIKTPLLFSEKAGIIVDPGFKDFFGLKQDGEGD